MSEWTLSDIADQSGKVFVITGANSGLGFESARALAAKNATVIMTSRTQEKGAAARQKIAKKHPSAAPDVMLLDLADLASVQRFAEAFAQKHDRLDVLMNNAGVMAIPQSETADGFEMQLGTNHLGHFALTGRLLALLLATPGSRIVNVSSSLHQRGEMLFDDLHGRQSYTPYGAYCNSKLANLLFTYALQRRLEATGAATISVGTHPGYAATNLQFVGSQMGGSRIRHYIMRIANRFVAQSATDGARSQVFSAVEPDINGGDYIGPRKGMSGEPAKLKSSAASYVQADQERLWEISVKETGVAYDVLTGSSPAAAS